MNRARYEAVVPPAVAPFHHGPPPPFRDADGGPADADADADAGSVREHSLRAAR